MTYVIYYISERVSKMKHARIIGKLIVVLTLCSSLVLPAFETSPSDSMDNLVIKGFVSNPINLTYSEVETFTTIWEIAQLQCVYAPNRTSYNWTGVPLFYLLQLANMQSEAREVVFLAEDGFSSSLTLDQALHPTTILALKVNGTTLPIEDGYWTGGLAGGYPYKVIVPCRWGYKWVGWIDEIEVVDYDYKGFYESMGFSDDADIPDCTQLPMTVPPYSEFNATWRDIYAVTVFSNATVLEAGFNQTVKHVHLSIFSNGNSESLVYVIIPKRLLAANFTVVSDDIEVGHTVMQGERNSFLYFILNEGSHTIEIIGMLIADVTGLQAGVPDRKVNMRDIGALARLFGVQKGDPDYIGNYDINDDAIIDMKDIDIAARDFGKNLP